jgi:hypothetical protein
MYIYIYIYIYIYTHTHTHTHTYMNTWNICEQASVLVHGQLSGRCVGRDAPSSNSIAAGSLLSGSKNWIGWIRSSTAVRAVHSKNCLGFREWSHKNRIHKTQRKNCSVLDLSRGLGFGLTQWWGPSGLKFWNHFTVVIHSRMTPATTRPAVDMCHVMHENTMKSAPRERWKHEQKYRTNIW